VKENFNYQYGRYYGSIVKIENQVLYQHFQSLQEKCKKEKIEKLNDIRDAQKYLFGDERTEKIKLVEKKVLNNCVNLKKFKKKVKEN